MEPIFTATQRRLLTAVFERGAEDASQTLSKWLGQPVQMTISAVAEADLSEASELLGPADELVGACTMGLGGPLAGHLLMVFEDRSGLALADLLLRNPIGTATAWGELEQSAAMETANIVVCAYLRTIAAHLPLPAPADTRTEAPLLPSPPSFRHEFAGSLLQFALMDQAVVLDRVLVAQTRFTALALELNWSLLLVPTGRALADLATALAEAETR